MQTPEWFRAVIAQGVARMSGLRFAPLDTLKEIEGVWAETIWKTAGPFKQSPEFIDRVSRTFTNLLANHREFPQIPDFTDELLQQAKSDVERKRDDILKLPEPPITPQKSANIRRSRASFFQKIRELPPRPDSIIRSAAKEIEKTSGHEQA